MQKLPNILQVGLHFWATFPYIGGVNFLNENNAILFVIVPLPLPPEKKPPVSYVGGPMAHNKV